MGLEDERLALALTERGLSRLLEDRIDEAVSDYTREKEIRELTGRYVPQSREANLAWGYMLQGRIKEADELLCDSIATRERLFGENDKESFRHVHLLNFCF